MLKKVLFFSIVLILFGVIFLFKDKIIGEIFFVLNLKNDKKVLLNSFPKQNFNTSDNNISISPVNVVVDKYGSVNGIDYVEVSYNINEKESETFKLALKLPESLLNTYLDKFEYDAFFKEKIIERYSKVIEVYENLTDVAESKTYSSFGDIKSFNEVFPTGRLFGVYFISNLPSTPITNSCLKDKGQDICFIADITPILAPDISNFWKAEILNGESIIIPYAIINDKI